MCAHLRLRDVDRRVAVLHLLVNARKGERSAGGVRAEQNVVVVRTVCRDASGGHAIHLAGRKQRCGPCLPSSVHTVRIADRKG